MHFQKLTYMALAASGVSAQTVNLTAALGSQSDLSALTALLASYPDLVTGLSNATNVTLLAPSNNALNTLLNSTAGAMAASSPGFIQALLSVILYLAFGMKDEH